MANNIRYKNHCFKRFEDQYHRSIKMMEPNLIEKIVPRYLKDLVNRNFDNQDFEKYGMDFMMDKTVLFHINDIVKKGILIYKKDTQTYEYNTDYEGNEDTIVLINLNKDETTIKEKEEVEERTIEDRKYVIEAYVMKLLKPKKQMKIDELIDGVVNAVKFPCEREFVLSRIKQLIDLTINTKINTINIISNNVYT